MRILIIAICFILYAFLPESTAAAFGVSETNLWGCLSYHFFHASWLHLIINAVCFYLLYKPVRTLWIKRLDDNMFLTNMYFSATFAGMFAAQSTPTVGLSGIVFAILGALLVLNPTKKQLQNYIYLALAVAIQMYFGRSNTLLHIFAFALGALTVIIHTAADSIRIKDTDE